MGVDRLRQFPCVLAAALLWPALAQSQSHRPAAPKQAPAVTMQMGELTGEFVQTRRLYLSGLHARLLALLAREGLHTDQAISRVAVESRRLRVIHAADTSGFSFTIGIAPDPEETSAQLVATCYVHIDGEYRGQRIVRGTPYWPRLERMADFLFRAQPPDL